MFDTTYLTHLLAFVGIPLVILWILLETDLGRRVWEWDDEGFPFKIRVDGVTVSEFADRRDAYRKASELSRERKKTVIVKRGWLTIAVFRGGVGIDR